MIEGPTNLTELTDAERSSILEDMIKKVPGFTMRSKPEPLTGGLLNFVWRIQGEPGTIYPSIIAKWAPPYVATNPEIELDPDRIVIEANALKIFGKDGALSQLTNEKIRLPAFVYLDTTHNILIMEDVCNCPDLSQWIQSPHKPEESFKMGKRIGSFIGNLHALSAERPDLAQQFSNPQIQQTRFRVLYQNVGMYAQRANLHNASEMGVAAVTYGELLQRSGKVVVMGDLWLPSVIVSGDDLRIIDWELAHYGHPSQDVGHLAAHLWMHMHRPPSASTAENAMNMLKGFLENYRIALGEEFNRIFGSEGLQESSIHFGSEILARTVGTFQEGYLYQGLPWDHADIQEAILMAASHITNPTSAGIFEPLQV